jgi:hypothetical protein
MALNSNNVRVGVTGAVYIGTDVAATPTDADTPLGAGWTDLGYCDESGVVVTPSRSTTDLNVWQNGETVRKVVTAASETFQFTLVETKKETLEVYLGGKLAADGSAKVVTSRTGGRRRWVIDVIDGDNYTRFYVPFGEVTEVGARTFANSAMIGYQITIQAYPSSEIMDEGEPSAHQEWHSDLAE